MAQERTYTYRAGERVELTKDDDAFVVRVLPPRARELGLEPVDQLSSASTKVTCGPEELDEVMAQTRRRAVAHHVYRTDEGSELLITDRVYVRFEAGLDADELARFATDYSLVLLDELSPTERLYELTDATGMNPVKLVQRLTESDERVLLAENDVNYRTTKSFDLPSDANYRSQWHLHRLSTDARFDARSSVRCDEAWQLLESYGSSDVVIAVTDDGCRLDHRDFDSPGKFAGWGYFDGWRLVVDSDIDADPARMYVPGADHGTSCAGVAAGEADGVLTVGAAPGCRLLPIRWESQGMSLFISDSKLRRALDYIAERADVMSNSWGHVPVNSVGAQVTSRVTQLSSSGGRRGTGIVFLWAAGNENCPIDHTASQAVPYDDGWERQGDRWVWVGPSTATVFRNDLAQLPGVVHVAALGSTARRSHYSNYGPGIDLCAPSSNRHTYLGEPLGLGVRTTRGTTATSTTTSFGGTSSATPLVAGVAALVISANPELGAGEVISVLQRTAAKDLDLTAWPRTPPNPVMGDTSWDVSPVAPFDTGAFTDTGHADGTWSPWFGFGRVDAAAAVAAARDTATPPPRPVLWEQTVHGQLADAGDRDSWIVNFSGTLRVELSGPADADFDLHLRREDPAAPDARSEGVGSSSHETIEVAALSPERWRVTVVSWRGAGAYSLHVRVSS